MTRKIENTNINLITSTQNNQAKLQENSIKLAQTKKKLDEKQASLEKTKQDLLKKISKTNSRHVPETTEPDQVYETEPAA